MAQQDAILERINNDLPLDDFFVIDSHGHNGGSWGHWVPFHEGPGIVTTLDRVGINMMCISAMKALANDVREGNDDMIALTQEFPGRFIGLAVANPRYTDEIYDELERCFQNETVRGIKIHPTTYVHHYPLNGPKYEPVWEFAKKHDCPILMHAGPRSEIPYCGPDLIDDVAQRHPEVKILIGHAGSYDSWQSLDEHIAVVKKHDNLFLETSTMNRFYKAVDYMVQEVGSERVIFGSDGPFHSIIAEFGSIVYARISLQEKENVLGRNMARLLGIDPDKWRTKVV